MHSCTVQDVVAVEYETSVKPVLHHPVGLTDSARYCIQLEVSFDKIPVALVAWSWIRLENDWSEKLFQIVPVSSSVVALPAHVGFRHAVAASSRTVLRYPNQIARQGPAARIDRLVVLNSHARSSTVLVTLLEIEDQVAIGEAVEIAVERAHHVKFVRVIRFSRAHPI